jgi:hypothetical protein
MSEELKVGDKIRVKLGTKHGSHYVRGRLGKTGKTNRLDRDGMFEVEWDTPEDDGEIHGIFWPDELEKI